VIFNFAKVNDQIFRSGQPIGEAQWRWAMEQGIKCVLKLNDSYYGDDSEAERVGLVVVQRVLSDHESQTVLSNPAVLDEIDSILTRDGPWLVHCVEGKDRSGIVIARYRVLHEGWTKEKALEEWKAYGSHGYRGLVNVWNAWNPGAR